MESVLKDLPGIFCSLVPEGTLPGNPNDSRVDIGAESFVVEVLHLESRNPRHQYTLQAKRLERSIAKKDLEILLDTKLNMNQQCALVVKCQSWAIL